MLSIRYWLFLLLLVPGQWVSGDDAPVRQLPAPEIEEHLDIVYADYGKRQMHVDLFVPQYESQAKPAVLVVHGGGWLNGDRTKFHAIARALARRGLVAAAVEYRLGGEAKFPAAIHDCNAATRWLRANAAKYGIDPEKIAAVGGSAGGHLVGLMAAAPHVKALQGSANAGTSSALQAAVVLAGPMELATGSVAERSRQDPENSNTNKWLGKTIDDDPALYELASPFTHLSKQTPPLLFMTGEFDLPQRNLPTRDKLREFGTATGILVYAEGKHGCWNREPWQSIMVDDMADFLFRQLGIAAPAFPLAQQAADRDDMRIDSQGVSVGVGAPTKAVSIPRLNNPLVAAKLIQNGTATESPIQVGLDQWTFAMPNDLVAGAELRIETVGRPLLPTIAQVITQSESGEVTLPAHAAVTHGEKLRYEPQPHKNTVGYWANADDWCAWQFYVERPGTFSLAILQGCGKGQGGSEVAAIAGQQKVTFTVEDTGHFQNFKEREIGTLTFDQPGVYSLELRPIRKAAGAVMDVRQMRLVPQS